MMTTLTLTNHCQHRFEASLSLLDDDAEEDSAAPAADADGAGLLLLPACYTPVHVEGHSFWRMKILAGAAV